MIRPEKVKGVSAMVCFISSVLLAMVVILGIWLEFRSRVVWKLAWTLLVVLLLSAFVHAVAHGMCQGTKPGSSK